ncbi:MAG: hypothetical protein LUB58_03995 [Oscillospiraceae bacterium]|nr:hypothetical protein [Oscillospiraceae bacterium]MCD7786519.1 hypothetical protein [Oscillospiraceae bacterium]MCD8240533.1 hypothetical protein [Oscillospiraceae bacterium]MCD8256363.1 hypothetical protein [Oscillospiraceae bacterium]
MAMSPARRASNDRYNAKCDFIAIKPLKDVGAEIRAAAAAAGQSLQGYILQAIRERMARDQQQADGAPTPPQDTTD